MLSTLITRSMLDFSSSAVDTPTRQLSHQRESLLPVPKLGPPLKARPDHKCPCITPALTSSRNKYSGSWNLSFSFACLIAVNIALASGECMCEFNRNLQFQTIGSCAPDHPEDRHSPSQFKEPPNNVGDNLVFLVQLAIR